MRNTVLAKRVVALALPVAVVGVAAGLGHGQAMVVADDTTTSSSIWVPKCVDVTVGVLDPPPWVRVCPIP